MLVSIWKQYLKLNKNAEVMLRYNKCWECKKEKKKFLKENCKMNGSTDFNKTSVNCAEHI
jgi:hypothetical protein